MTDYAILVAISWYPGLTHLEGPENDLDDFKNWLASPTGGNLVEGTAADFPNPSTSTLLAIRSSDYPPVRDPYEAHPAELEFKRALNKLLYKANGEFRKQVGNRLYLYFAGHGFNSKDRDRQNDAALYTAQANQNDSDHIPGTRYATRIANSYAFDEIVLVMDCCRDLDLSDVMRPPSIVLPEHPDSARVRVLEAYATGRGQKSRERVINGAVRGLFTQLFVEALRNAKGDVAGVVSGKDIQGYVFDRWPKFFDPLPAPYEPHIHGPGGSSDIVFVRRKQTHLIDLEFRFVTPTPKLGTYVVIYDAKGREVARALVQGASANVQLPDGLYKAVLSDDARRSVNVDLSTAVTVEL